MGIDSSEDFSANNKLEFKITALDIYILFLGQRK